MNEGIETTYSLSSRKRRLVAYMIDHTVMSFLLVAMVFSVLGVNFIEEVEIMPMRIFLVVLIGILLYLAKDAINGISFGRWIMGIMVRDKNDPNKTPSLSRLLSRNVFLMIWPVEFVKLATDRNKERFGDKMAQTIVIRNPKRGSLIPKVAVLTTLFIVLFSFMFLFISSTMMNSDAYKLAVKEIEQNEEIVTELGGIVDYGVIPMGSISITNGVGRAHFEITVIGNDKEMNISVSLGKSVNQEWELLEMYIN